MSSGERSGARVPAALVAPLLGTLFFLTLSAAWEPPDLRGATSLVVPGAVGLAVGVVFAVLRRRTRAGGWRGFGALYWLVAYGASRLLFPSALASREGQGVLPRVAFYVVNETPPRVFANLAAAYGLFPWATGIATVTLLGAIAVVGRGTSRAARSAAVVVLSSALGFAVFYGFKLGPPAHACARTITTPGVRRVVATEELRRLPGLGDGRPYDVQPVGESLVVSVKVGARSLGALVLVDRESGAVEDVLALADVLDPVPPPPAFPERMAVRDNQVSALVLGTTNALVDAVVEDGRFVSRHALSLGAEPNSVLLDPHTDRGWVFLSSATASGALELTGTPPRIARASPDAHLAAPFQYSDLSPDGRRLAVTTSAVPGLYLVDAEHGVVEDTAYRSALIGVHFDRDGRSVYAADPLRGRLVRIDVTTLAISGAVSLTGSGLADVDLDPELGLVVVGSYTGELGVYTTPELAPVARTRLGWLLRNVTVDARRHEAFAASGCGVYAWDLGGLGAGRSPSVASRPPR